MTDIGELVARIKVDGSQLNSGMDQATGKFKQSTEQMGKAAETLKEQLMELVPALSVAAFVEYGKSAVEAASNLQNMADRIGFSASTLSALQPMLAKTGSSVDEFSHSVYMMNSFIQQAIDGNPKALDTLDKLGLSAMKLKAMRPEDAMNAMVDAIFKLGNITDQTSVGREVFSRSWAALIPIMIESHGHMEDAIKDAKDMGEALSDDKIKRVHDFGTALEDAGIRAKNAFVSALAAVLDYYDGLKKANDEFEKAHTFPDPTDGGTHWPGQAPPSQASWSWLNGGTRKNRKGQLIDENGNVISAATLDTSAMDYADNDNLYPSSMAAGKGSPLAQAAGNNNALRPKVIPPDNSLKNYIDNLNKEAAAAEVSTKELFINRAEIEAGTKARADYAAGIRTTDKLTDEEKASVDAAAAALYDHKEALAQNKMIADQLTNSLTKIIVNFKDMKSAITDLFESIAQEMIKTQIAKPIATSLTSSLPSISGGFGSLFSGFGKLLGFADGGSPPVGVPSIVGENGPELFVPNQAGTIVPNGKMGGTSIVVQQSFVLNPGATEQTVAQLRNMAPQIAAMAHASIAQDIQNGGPLSRIVGRKS